MAGIVSINLRKQSEGWLLSVVKDVDFKEVHTEETKEITDAIEQIVKFAENIKSEEEKKIEELENLQKEALKVIKQKTTLNERIKMVELLKRWQEGEDIQVNDERVYNDKLYIAKKKHKSSYENIPINDKSTWRLALSKKELPDIYNHEKKYKINEKCRYNGRIYSSLIVQEGQSPFASPKTWEDEGVI
ncbi:hypothetical protein ABGF48_03240 [Helcococcus bovis]|uniref:hypothetical protein n=1 Tax=Helcococcus bovis TaxID=3153252 RepID=UPI0038B8747A